jgi:Flp pilus assembly protein TadG
MRRSVMSPHRRRRGQRGQVVVLVALSAIALLGATALAVDLTGQASAHRTVQNWTDAAAMAGVRDCDTSCSAKIEVQDALANVLANSPWKSSLSWATSAPLGTCNANRCVVTNYPGPGLYGNYQVSVSSPPVAPGNPSYNTTNYVEVDVAERSSTTNLAAVLGATSTLSTGHSIANDSGLAAPYQYAFFAKRQTGSGNDPQVITGDAYLGDGYVPQSGKGGGQDGLCVNEIPGSWEPSGDVATDSSAPTQDNDADDQGRAVFDHVPPIVGPEPSYAQPNSPCPRGGQVNVQTGGPATAAGCPTNSALQADPVTGTVFCYQASPPVPNVTPPTATAALPCAGNTATVDGSTLPGVYSVAPNCVVSIMFDPKPSSIPVNINCVSLLLSAGSSVATVNKQATVYMTPYGFDPTGDTAAAQAFAKDGLTEPTTACPGAATSASNGDRSVIWAPDTSVNPMPTALVSALNGVVGSGSDTLFVGTIFLPDQQITYTSNESVEDVGSVYCGQWNVQSGAHPNPIVTYDPGATSGVGPTIRLVE